MEVVDCLGYCEFKGIKVYNSKGIPSQKHTTDICAKAENMITALNSSKLKASKSTVHAQRGLHIRKISERLTRMNIALGVSSFKTPWPSEILMDALLVQKPPWRYHF